MSGGESRRPADTPFKQQRLPAWQPILSPPWVVSCFFLVSVAFIPIGAVIVVASASVVEYEYRYDDSTSMYSSFNSTMCPLPPNSTNATLLAILAAQNITCNGSSADPPQCPTRRFDNITALVGRNISCTEVFERQRAVGLPPCCTTSVTLSIDKAMEPPVYVYYKLDNFYQNHRRYAESRSDTQLAGESVTFSKVKECAPFAYPGQADPNPAPEPSGVDQLYNPCGLIAWSMYNDSISISSTVPPVFTCRGEAPDNVTCTKEGIAWPSDRTRKFKQDAAYMAQYYSYPNEYKNEAGHKVPWVGDEDLMVWMRSASLPSFRKLYRKINVRLPPGRYTVDIVQRYPVHTFDGRKAVVLSTTTWIGGRNEFLGAAYIVVGALCLVLAAAFLVKHLVAPRTLGELAFLQSAGDAPAQRR